MVVSVPGDPQPWTPVEFLPNYVANWKTRAAHDPGQYPSPRNLSWCGSRRCHAVDACLTTGKTIGENTWTGGSAMVVNRWDRKATKASQWTPMFQDLVCKESGKCGHYF
jgi:hypothetical protein